MDIPMHLHFFLQYISHITAPTCYLHTLYKIVSQSSVWVSQTSVQCLDGPLCPIIHELFKQKITPPPTGSLTLIS